MILTGDKVETLKSNEKTTLISKFPSIKPRMFFKRENYKEPARAENVLCPPDYPNITSASRESGKNGCLERNPYSINYQAGQTERKGDYGGLYENGPHGPIGSGTSWRFGLVEGSLSLQVAFEISNAQARPSVTLSFCCLRVRM